MTPDPDRFGPLGIPYVVVDLAAEPVLPQVSCPMIGFGDAGHPLAAQCDAVVATPAALARITRNISQAPIAAAVLVQVLRAAEHVPLHQALILESLAYATVQNTGESRALLAANRPPSHETADGGPPVLLSRTPGGLAVRLNRPGSRNEMTIEVRDSLAEALQLAALDQEIETITLSGVGRCFSVGGALREFGTAPDQGVAHAIRVQRGPAFALAPVAGRAHAMVHGACIGAGAELASLCGRVSADPCTFFQLPEIRYGLIPGAGGTVGFARRIGRQRTAYLALSAARLNARQALAWGLVDDIAVTAPIASRHAKP